MGEFEERQLSLLSGVMIPEAARTSGPAGEGLCQRSRRDSTAARRARGDAACLGRR